MPGPANCRSLGIAQARAFARERRNRHGGAAVPGEAASADALANDRFRHGARSELASAVAKAIIREPRSQMLPPGEELPAMPIATLPCESAAFTVAGER